MAQERGSENSDQPSLSTRPVGGTEYGWCKAVPGGTGSTVLSLLLSKPPQIPHLQNALHKLQISHPILRSKIHFDTTTNTFQFVTPPNPRVQIQPFDLESTSQILQTQANDNDPIDPFHALLEYEMNRDTWRDTNDVDVMYASTYAIDEKRFALFLRLHTSVCDRAAAVALLNELLRLVARGGGDDGGEAKGSGDKVNLAIEDLIPEGKKNKPFWARGFDVLGYSLNAFRFSNLSFVDTDSPRSSRMVRLQLNADETKRLLDVSHHHSLLLLFSFLIQILVFFIFETIYNN
jgi:hypothetical protein